MDLKPHPWVSGRIDSWIEKIGPLQETSTYELSAKEAPHCPQNLKPGGLSAPHCGHAFFRGAAHSPQNFMPGGFSKPQAEQVIFVIGWSVGAEALP